MLHFANLGILWFQQTCPSVHDTHNKAGRMCLFDFPYPSYDIQLEQAEHHQKKGGSKDFSPN